MGFICWECSPRYVSEVPAYLPKCQRVGVFVNPSLDYVLERTKAFGFNFIQLHGTESPEFCQAVGDQTDLPVIKALSIASAEDVDLAEEYECDADMFIFDTKCPTNGGSGRQFNWEILRRYHGEVPFLLSGGIGPDDVERLKQWHHYMCWGFDLNSRFEKEPGIKDVNALENFISALYKHS